jgi:hypothetical protein
MAVTRSRAAERAQPSHGGRRAIVWRSIVWRRREAIRMLAASLMLLLGFFLVYRAKTRSFAEIETGLAGKQLLNLNDLTAREDLLPYLATSPNRPSGNSWRAASTTPRAVCQTLAQSPGCGYPARKSRRCAA